MTEFLESVHYLRLDTDDSEGFQHLREKVHSLHEQYDTGGNTMYYLSTPPHLFSKIAQGLKEQRLHKHKDPEKWVRIVIEKPFGTDLDSSRTLNDELTSIFREKQIYRIDHYLGKETVQNVLAFRFGNVLFDPIWNRKYVDRVVITASESIGVGHRGGYYDSAGAIRDMIQNHLLQVTALIGMEPPARFTDDAVRNETIKLFQSIRPFSLDTIRTMWSLGNTLQVRLMANVNQFTVKKRVFPIIQELKLTLP